jgi:2,2-dialkylglycine decarboxylase (pyruvate)
VTSAESEREAHDRGYLFLAIHVSDPLPAAVGNVVLDVLARDGLDHRAQHLGSSLYEGLDEIAGNHEVVADVRCRPARRARTGLRRAGAASHPPRPGTGAAREHRAAEIDLGRAFLDQAVVDVVRG